MPGYTRLNATTVGIGAGEILNALVEHLVEEDPLEIGRVLRPYDRSAYVRLRSDLTDTLPFRGPRLILLGTRDASGPLTVEIGDEAPGGFDPRSIDTDAGCQLQTAGSRTRGDTNYVFVVGKTLDVRIDRPLLESDGGGIPLVRALSEIDRGGPCWRHAVSTLDWLIESDLTDGLGWAPRLEKCVKQADGDEELEELAAAWYRCVTTGVEGELPDVVTDVLGRGPGATPSGDDILSGILLTLLHTTEGGHRDGVLAAGDALVGTAVERTTTISTALLAQAALGRAPAAVTGAITSLLHPNREADLAVLRTLTERGHTSGVDILLGSLLTILLVGPAYQT